MESRNLPSALCDSITDEARSSAASILEVGLDSVLDDGLLKDVPLLSTAASLYKISATALPASSVIESHNASGKFIFSTYISSCYHFILLHY